MASQDTEITLGMGKLLGLFFALAALCAVFLGVGYSLGKNSVKNSNAGDASLTSADGPSSKTGGTVQPAAENKPDLNYYKAVEQKEPDAKLSAPEPAPALASDPMVPKTASAAPEMTHASSGGYVVQVAAVSKQEDAQALAEALKKKSYAVLIATNPPNDKLYHVQVGPFADITDAETTRNRLVTDGYNPILKK